MGSCFGSSFGGGRRCDDGKGLDQGMAVGLL